MACEKAVDGSLCEFRSEQLLPGLAVHALHRQQESPVARTAEIVDGQDIRMFEASGNRRFAAELRLAQGILRLSRIRVDTQSLHRNDATQAGLFGLPHFAHAS